MVKIFGESVFVGDYELTINIGTDLGFIQILTNSPRLNKWIGVKSVDTFSIYPDERIGLKWNKDLHVRDLQTFLHQVLMKVEPIDGKTLKIVERYRKVNAEN